MIRSTRVRFSEAAHAAMHASIPFLLLCRGVALGAAMLLTCDCGAERADSTPAEWDIPTTFPRNRFADSKVPLLYFGPDGRFCATRLDLAEPVYVSPHRIELPGTLQISPNERFALYEENLEGKERSVLVLFDSRACVERTLGTFPPYAMGNVEFSPDSEWVAGIIIGYPPRVQREQEGIYLYHTRSQKQSFIPYPSQSRIPQADVMGREMKWSADGKRLYLAFNVSADSTCTIEREFLQLDPRSGECQRVAGEYVGYPTYDNAFRDHGTTVALHENLENESNRLNMDLLSHDRKYRAMIDKQYRLQVSGPGLGPEIVAEGKWTSGDGDVTPISIAGWIGNRYLVYSLHHEEVHLFDVKTKRSVPLFRTEIHTYAWLDDHKESGIKPLKSDAASPFISLVVPPIDL